MVTVLSRGKVGRDSDETGVYVTALCPAGPGCLVSMVPRTNLIVVGYSSGPGRLGVLPCFLAGHPAVQAVCPRPA